MPQDVPIADGSTNPASERLISLDFVRGIAVMGILWANIIAFGQPMSAYTYPGAFNVPPGRFSDALWFAQMLLIDGKMRGLFTLLFGAGLFLFMEKAWARGISRLLQFRRLVWLLVFGLAHYFLLWRGDILVTYAVIGMAATLCLRWEAKQQLVAGILGYIVGGMMLISMTGMPVLIAESSLGSSAAYTEMKDAIAAQQQHDLADGQLETRIISKGNYREFVAHNISAHASDLGSRIYLGLLETFPLMLIGMALYRYGLFDGGLGRAAMCRWGWIGLISGMVLTVPVGLWALRGGITYWGSLAAIVGFSHLQRLPMMLGLLALLVLLASHAGGWLGQRVIAAGRMAFSNYLGTTFMMVLVFHGGAGGLFGKLDRGELYLVMLAAWVLMLAWSRPWLARFRYGPLEWLWRCLTYWRLFPLLR